MEPPPKVRCAHITTIRVQPIDSICSSEEHRRCVGDTTFLLAAWQKILLALAIANQIPSGVMGARWASPQASGSHLNFGYGGHYNQVSDIRDGGADRHHH